MTQTALLKRVKKEMADRLAANRVEAGKIEIAFWKREDDWWYLTVTPAEEPTPMGCYYQALAEVEVGLRREMGIDVALVPVYPEDAPRTIPESKTSTTRKAIKRAS